MALATPITISEQARILRDSLATWATPLGGKAVVVHSVKQLWEQAVINSQVPRVLICYNGSRPRGAFKVSNALNREDRDWIIALTRGRGYHSVRGDALSDDTGVEPLYDWIEQIRDFVRNINNISEETPCVDYSGIKPMTMGNLVVDGYMITFSTANDIPKPINT